ncbi:hypothetical protein BC937DRAFT_87860 [Endogone sp. FLAS-F59071]|nr:hypothetical protein BC937DRAFT_87860 [Endogone sp. FLAS-F59071]|eukprot:RUS19193.1 hypothetical protein BC937DRAFT_87860 [Endogone sp. FLAS-F59071]
MVLNLLNRSSWGIGSINTDISPKIAETHTTPTINTNKNTLSKQSRFSTGSRKSASSTDCSNNSDCFDSQDDDDVSTAPTSASGTHSMRNSLNNNPFSKHTLPAPFDPDNVPLDPHSAVAYLTSRIHALEHEIERSGSEIAERQRREVELQVQLKELQLRQTEDIERAVEPLRNKLAEFEDVRGRMLTKVDDFIAKKQERTQNTAKRLNTRKSMGSMVFDYAKLQEEASQRKSIDTVRSQQTFRSVMTIRSHFTTESPNAEMERNNLVVELNELQARYEDSLAEFQQMKYSKEQAESELVQQRQETETMITNLRTQILQFKDESTSTTAHHMRFLNKLLNHIQNPGTVKAQDAATVILELTRKKDVAEEALLQQEQDSENAISHLNAEIDSYKEQLTDLRQQKSALEISVKEYQIKLEQALDLSATSTRKAHALEGHLEELTKQKQDVITSSKKDHAELNARYDQYLERVQHEHRASMEALQDLLNHREHEFAVAWKEVMLLRGSQERSVVMSEELEKLREENRDMERAVEEMRTEMEGMITEASADQERLRMAEQQVERLRAALECDARSNSLDEVDSQIFQRVRALESLREDAEARAVRLTEEKRQADLSVRRAQFENKSLQSKLRQAMTEKETAERNLMQQVAEKEKYIDRIGWLEDEILRLTDKAKILEKERAEWELRTEVAKSMTRKVERDANEAVEELQERLEEAQETIMSLRSAINEIDNQCQKAFSERDHHQWMTTSLQTTIAGHEAAISSLRGQIHRMEKEHDQELNQQNGVNSATLNKLQMQHDTELAALRKEMQSRIESDTRKHRDISAVQSARQLNSLESRIKELEFEIEEAEERYSSKIRLLERQLREEHSEKLRFKESLERGKREWDNERSGFQGEFRRVERKIGELEEEVRRMLTKNMELVVELSKCQMNLE